MRLADLVFLMNLTCHKRNLCFDKNRPKETENIGSKKSLNLSYSGAQWPIIINRMKKYKKNQLPRLAKYKNVKKPARVSGMWKTIGNLAG